MSHDKTYYAEAAVSTFLEDVQMFPENVADVWRSTQEESVSSLAQQVQPDALELGCVDTFEVEVVNSPL